MLGANHTLDFKVDCSTDKLVIHYTPKTDRTIYDLCDLNGRVIRTGIINSKRTELETKDLKGGKYVVLIVDGDKVLSHRVNLAA